MPSPAFRPDVLKLLGLKNWDSLRDEAMANLARKRRIWAENAEARQASLQRPSPISDRTTNADSHLWDLKDLGLRALFGDQDDENQARNSDSEDDSDSDEELSVEGPDDSNDKGSDEEDSGEDGDEGSDGGDEEESSEEDDGVEERDVTRARLS